MNQTDAGLAIEHEVQRLMLERLGIEWTPGEPFYSLIEGEITRLRAALEDLGAWSRREIELLRVENEQLKVRLADQRASSDKTISEQEDSLDFWRHQSQAWAAENERLRADNEHWKWAYETNTGTASEQLRTRDAEITRLRAALERLVELGEDDGSAPDTAWKDAWDEAAKMLGRDKARYNY